MHIKMHEMNKKKFKWPKNSSNGQKIVQMKKKLVDL